MNGIVIISVFFIIWALLHSVLAARPMKAWMRRTFGEQTVSRWYRFVYNVVSVLTVLPLFPLLAWLPDRTLYVVPAPWRWLMVAGQCIALVSLIATLLQTDLGQFVGLTQLTQDSPTQRTPSLQTDGFYGWVRHPLYTFSLLFIWLSPAMTVNLLSTYVLFTLYFYIGSIHEEHRLLAEFGDDYRAYQQRVPRLIPRIPPKYRPDAEVQ